MPYLERARASDPRDDQPRASPTARWSSRSPRSTATTCSAARTGSGAPYRCTAPRSARCSSRSARPSCPPGRLERLHPEDDHDALGARSGARRDPPARLRRRRTRSSSPGSSPWRRPVRRDDGTVVAALSVSGPSTRLGPSRVADVAAQCVERGQRPVGGARLPTTKRKVPREPGRASQSRCTTPTLVGNAPVVLELTNAGLGDGPRPRDAAVRVAHPLARGGRGALRARRLLRARDAHRGQGDGRRARGAAAPAGRDRRRAGRHVRHGHRQGRRARHRQEPGEHHARGRRVPRHRPRRPGRPGALRRGDPGAQARHRRFLGLPHDDDADVQGEHQRAREGRAARPGDRHGRRGPGDPGVRRRRRRRRLRARTPLPP